MFKGNFRPPLFRPALNLGGLLDIPTGKYEQGRYGEMILNGGLDALTGIASRPNNFKTALAIYMLAAARRAMPHMSGITYDSEGTLNAVPRFNAVSQTIEELAEIDWENDELYANTDISQYTGDEFFTEFRKLLSVKEKEVKNYTRTTPFIDVNGKVKTFTYPSVGLIDSFSKFQISEVDLAYAKHDIGNSKLNTTAMTNGKAKKQLFDQLPQICAKSGTHVILTAHVSDVINMDMFPTDKRNLTGMKRDTIIMGVSGGFYSLPNNVWDITANRPLLNKDKMPVYPLDNATAIMGDSDLRQITIKNLRGKSGISDLPFNIIFSQTEGYMPSLSEFDYCKERDFGIGGNQQNYYIELLPEVKLSRTVIRNRLNTNPMLRRAVEIQSEMGQLIEFQRWTSEDVCTPKELYEDLKAMGYDWDVILGKTRGYWMCEEDSTSTDKNFLSTYDLLRMRKGLYKPYWMTDAEKAAIQPLELVKG